MPRACVALTLLLTACGARSALSIEEEDAAAPGFDAAVGIDAARPDAGHDGGPDAGPPWACRYEPVGEPIVLFMDGRHGEGVGAPELLVLDDAPGEARLAVAAMHGHFWHPEIHLAEVFVGDAWPDGVRVGRDFVHVGIDSHGSGQLTPTADGDDVALAWYQGDLARGAPAGVAFRRLDAASWRPDDGVIVSEDAGYAYSIVPWAAGYALAYRSAYEEGTPGTEARIGFLDAAGNLVGEPIVASERSAGPLGTMVAASDTELLVATNDEAGTTFSRVTPALSLETTGRVDALEARRPRSPTIRAHGDAAWAVWREEALDDEDPTFAIRLAQLDGRGTRLGMPLEEIAEPFLGPALDVSPLGAIVMWGQAGDATSPGEIGYQRIMVRRATPDGALAEGWEVPTTSLDYGEAYDAATLRGGRVLLVTWGAAREGGGEEVVWLARFDCVLL